MPPMTDAFSPPPEAALPLSRRPGRGQKIAAHAAVWVLTLAFVALAVDRGLRLRRWTWDITAPIHFRNDITRGYGWGFVSSGGEGYLNQYEKMARHKGRALYLEYAPLRLAVMTRWAAHNRAIDPRASD